MHINSWRATFVKLQYYYPYVISSSASYLRYMLFLVLRSTTCRHDLKGGELFLATDVVRMFFRNGVSSPFSEVRNGNPSRNSADAAVPRMCSLP